MPPHRENRGWSEQGTEGIKIPVLACSCALQQPRLSQENAGVRAQEEPGLEDSSWGGCGWRGCTLCGFGGFGEVQPPHFGNLRRVGVWWQAGILDSIRIPSGFHPFHQSRLLPAPSKLEFPCPQAEQSAGAGAVGRNKLLMCGHILPPPSQNLQEPHSEAPWSQVKPELPCCFWEGALKLIFSSFAGDGQLLILQMTPAGIHRSLWSRRSLRLDLQTSQVVPKC